MEFIHPWHNVPPEGWGGPQLYPCFFYMQVSEEALFGLPEVLATSLFAS